MLLSKAKHDHGYALLQNITRVASARLLPSKSRAAGSDLGQPHPKPERQGSLGNKTVFRSLSQAGRPSERRVRGTSTNPRHLLALTSLPPRPRPQGYTVTFRVPQHREMQRKAQM